MDMPPRRLTIYAYNPEGLELDDCLKVLKEFRERVPKTVDGGYLSSRELGYIQAMLNIIDYISIPEKLSDNSAEA
jgi:hypothetical protein